MKPVTKNLKSVLAITAILTSSVFSSTAQTSRFALSLNSLSTNFNYGKSNSEMRPYKKDYKGLQFGISYQAGVTKAFSIVPELYLQLKAERLLNKTLLQLTSLHYVLAPWIYQCLHDYILVNFILTPALMPATFWPPA